MYCSMCNNVPVKDTHKCAKCGETCCRHIHKVCPKCKPTPAMVYDDNALVWVPVDIRRKSETAD